MLVHIQEYYASVIDYPRNGCVYGQVTSVNFGICDIISETMQDEDLVAVED